MYKVEITTQYIDKNKVHSFKTLNEANNYLVGNGFIYDSGDEDNDYWTLNQFTFASVSLNREEY